MPLFNSDFRMPFCNEASTAYQKPQGKLRAQLLAGTNWEDTRKTQGPALSWNQLADGWAKLSCVSSIPGTNEPSHEEKIKRVVYRNLQQTYIQGGSQCSKRQPMHCFWRMIRNQPKNQVWLKEKGNPAFTHPSLQKMLTLGNQEGDL